MGAKYSFEVESIETGAGNYFTKDTAKGPCTYSQTFTRTLSSEISGEIGISVKEIAAKIGAGYVNKRKFSKRYSVPVPKGKQYTIYAHPQYNDYSVKVFKNRKFVGSRVYRESIGIYAYWQDTTNW